MSDITPLPMVRLSLLLLGLQFSACTLVTDVDRSKITADTESPSGTETPGEDAAIPPDGGSAVGDASTSPPTPAMDAAAAKPDAASDAGIGPDGSVRGLDAGGPALDSSAPADAG